MSSKNDQLLLDEVAGNLGFEHQLSSWKVSSHYRRGGSEQGNTKDMK
jgi:hypothetical protein